MFGTADDTLIIAQDSDQAAHDKMLCKLLQISTEENLKAY